MIPAAASNDSRMAATARNRVELIRRNPALLEGAGADLFVPVGVGSLDVAGDVL